MSLPDFTASTALGAMVIKPVFFVFLDLDGAQVRANTSGANITPTGTGDPDLDGHEFIGIAGDFIDLSPIQHSEGGSGSVTAELSGIPEVDDDTLALLGDPTKWRGRDARVWQIIRNAANAQQGGYRDWHTGRMTTVYHRGAPGDGFTIGFTIEGYLAVLSQASNRTYLDQDQFDSGDQSARAAIAIANGNFSEAPTTTTYTNGADPYSYSGLFS